MLKSEIINKFKGTIQGVEITNEQYYWTTEWAMELVSHKLDFVPSVDLIKEFVNALDRAYFKLENFSFAELENEWDACLTEVKEGNLPQDLDTPYFEEAIKKLIWEFENEIVYEVLLEKVDIRKEWTGVSPVFGQVELTTTDLTEAISYYNKLKKSFEKIDFSKFLKTGRDTVSNVSLQKQFRPRGEESLDTSFLDIEEDMAPEIISTINVLNNYPFLNPTLSVTAVAHKEEDFLIEWVQGLIKDRTNWELEGKYSNVFSHETIAVDGIKIDLDYIISKLDTSYDYDVLENVAINMFEREVEFSKKNVDTLKEKNSQLGKLKSLDSEVDRSVGDKPLEKDLER